MSTEPIQQIKMDILKNSFNLIHSTINKCTTKGQFTLDEAYLLKLNLNNLFIGIETLEKYQTAMTDVTEVTNVDENI